MTKKSQHAIEDYLDMYFKKRKGTFLEIGCWDGSLISQTYWLENTMGWTGLCVDPFPIGFEHRKCKLERSAISKTGGERAFIKVSIDRRHGGLVSYFSGFEDHIQTHWPLIEQFCDYEKIIIPTITFEELCSRHKMPGHIEFLSVDVEGSEIEIFEAIDFTKHTFDMIVFEHNENETTQRVVGHILNVNGYRLLERLRCDDIYIRRSL